MRVLLAGAKAYQDGKLKYLDIAVDGERIVGVGTGIPSSGFDAVFHLEGRLVIPGFVDIRTRYEGLYRIHSSTVGGRVPTRDISPRRTLIN